jgi:hypothetical protein
MKWMQNELLKALHGRTTVAAEFKPSEHEGPGGKHVARPALTAGVQRSRHALPVKDIVPRELTA